jgi:ABC-type multidrug transport system fused ATPase/permease subunit
MLHLQKLFLIFPDLKFQYFKLIIYSLIISTFDFLSIFLVAPIIKVIIDPNYLKDSQLNTFYSIFDQLGNNFILFLLIFFLFFFALKGLFSLLLIKKIFKFCYLQQSKLRLNILSYYLRIPLIKFLTKSFQSKYISITDLTRVSTEDALVNFLRISSDIIVLSILVLFLLYFYFKITLAIIIFIFIFSFLYKILLQKKIYSYGKISIDSLRGIIKNTETTLNSIKEIKVFQKENFILKKLKESSDAFATSTTSRIVMTFLPKYLIEIFSVIFISCITFSLFFIEKNIQSLIPVLATLVVAFAKIFPLIHQILSSSTILWNSQYAIDKLFSINFHSKISIKKKIHHKINKISFNKKILFKKINFSYQKNMIFNNISFEFHANKTSAIFGPSGSGKTSLLHIFIGLIAIDKGQIIVDDKVILRRKYSLIGQVAYIPQDPILIDDTIKNNIIFDNIFNQSKFDSAIKLSNLQNFIKKQKNGVNTFVGHLGQSISGGQRQRIAIARALYNNKPIIVLDEPTSSLDRSSKQAILDTISNLNKKITIIIVSHDPEIKKYCDRIINLL